MLVFALTSIATSVVLLEKSNTEERLWLALHSDQGPYLLGVWYRAPDPGQTEGVDSFKEELCKHQRATLGTLVVGDFNVHHKKWLVYSARNSPEGSALEETSRNCGLRQLVREPTREDYLLDLVLTDQENVSCKVRTGVSDHKLVTSTLKLQVPKTETVPREVWDFAKADWDTLKELLQETDWTCLASLGADEGAEYFNKHLLTALRKCVPHRLLWEKKRTHPWLTDEVLALVAEKRRAKGTPQEAEATRACSEGTVKAYWDYVQQVRKELATLKQGDRKWWSKSRELLELKGKTCSIPALKDDQGAWVTTASDKANLFSRTFGKKYTLPAAENNEYSTLEESAGVSPTWAEPKEEDAAATLKALNGRSATGPDLVPTRVLKECAAELAKPLETLARRVLEAGRWPEAWVLHWILPLFKKKEPWAPGNYRGVHLTSQVGKTVERLLQKSFGGFLSSAECAGMNQFAYRKERGARDLLALLVLSWLLGFDKGRKYCLYCSDVAGAFDRVEAERLTNKLRTLKVPEQWVALFASWLRARTARVVVGGVYSEAMTLENMVFQGTVWGPVLWNAFYKDALRAVREAGFTESVYADDLNAYKSYAVTTKNETLFAEGKGCQDKLHKWGRANRVCFDPLKESFHVLARTGGSGGNWEQLGVSFDTGLTMEDAVRDTVTAVSWKLRTLQRSARFHTDRELVNLYKGRVLSFLEYRTAAVYHATCTVLGPLDRLQENFLRNAGVTQLEALMVFNLAPLAARRDMAMLGLIHRTVLGKGPEQFKEFFYPAENRHTALTRLEQRRKKHGAQLQDPRRHSHLNVVRRSALGLVAVYNLLPASVVQQKSVKEFQSALRELLQERATANCDDWPLTFSPRVALWKHPLK